MATKEDQLKERTAAAKRSGFKGFLADPMTRFGMSQIPAGNQADTLRMLLQAAFESGYNTGQGAVVGELLTSLLNKKRDDK